MDGQGPPDGDWLAAGPLGVFAAVLAYDDQDNGTFHLAFLPNDQLDECVPATRPTADAACTHTLL